MSNEETSFLQQLDQHDYDVPNVGDIRTGVIVAINQQGIIVDLGLKRDGLVPPTDLAKLDPEERKNLKINDEIPVFIMNTDEPESLIVSIHLAQMNQDWIDAEKLLASSEVLEGEVIGYNKGGAIVPYGRLRGFIPASHLVDLTPGMSDRKRQQKLAKLRGQKLPLKIIEVDRRRKRLVFSQRDAQKEWDEQRKQELLANLKEGDVLTGHVTGLRDFGIFVDIGGADGLVHVSELAWHRIDHPKDVVKVGDEIQVMVLKLSAGDQRISLSRKRVLPNPWDTVSERYKINQLVEGTVTRIVDYGAFAEIEPGVEGLLHLSQLSRNNVANTNDVVKEGETHLLRVVSIDQERQRIGLSLKAVTTNEQIDWMARRQMTQPEVVDETPAPKGQHPAFIEDEPIESPENEPIESPELQAETAVSLEVEPIEAEPIIEETNSEETVVTEPISNEENTPKEVVSEETESNN